MAQLAQSTAATRVFQLGSPSVNPTAFQISKNGGAFAAPTSSIVTSLGSGFYSVSLSTTDTNTLGDLTFNFTGGTGVTQPIVVDRIVTAGLISGIGSLPNDGTGAMSLKSLTISNSGSTSVSIGGAIGVAIVATGQGIQISGPSEGMSITSSSGDALRMVGASQGCIIESTGSLALQIQSLASQAVQIISNASTAMIIQGTGKAMQIVSSGNNPGILFSTGTGYAIDAASSSGGFDGIITPTPIVELAASQPLYAPSKAGDKMDLINAPNATALAAIWAAGSTFVGGQLNDGSKSIDLKSLTIDNTTGPAVVITGSTDGVQVTGGTGNTFTLTGGTNGIVIAAPVGIDVDSSDVALELTGGTGSAISATTTGAACITLSSPGEPAVDYTATTGFDPTIVATVGPVELASSQPLYAPAKQGDEMDLIDSPNVNALNAIATAIFTLSNSVETGWNLQQALSIMLSACAGMSTLVSDTRIYRDVNNTVNRIEATIDMAGQRLAVALTPA